MCKVAVNRIQVFFIYKNTHKMRIIILTNTHKMRIIQLEKEKEVIA